MIQAYFDGGTVGNRVCIIIGGTRKIIPIRHKQTNNQLEYIALLHVLRFIKKAFNVMDVTKIIIKGDSKLIVDQIHGDNEVRSPKLIDLYEQVVAEMDSIMFNSDTNLIWVPRNENLAGKVLEK